MTTSPVSSSNIKEIGHDPATNTLHVEFHSGAHYEYAGVSADKYQALLAAPSIGGHLNQHIKGSHDFVKL